MNSTSRDDPIWISGPFKKLKMGRVEELNAKMKIFNFSVFCFLALVYDKGLHV